MHFGYRLKQLRLAKGLTQAQLGACFNLAESSISLYESGKRSPDYTTLKKMAAFFGVTADYLLGHPENADIARESSATYAQKFQPHPLPVITLTKKGASLHYEETGSLEWYVCPTAEIQGRLFWYQVNETTHRDEGILPGDLALIQESAQISQGRLHLVYLAEEGGSRLSRVFQQDNALILPCPNPLQAPRIYSGKEASKLTIIGTVKEIRRRY